MLRRLSLIGLAGIALLATEFGWAGAGARAQSAEDELVDAFLGLCVLNLPHHEKIRASARLFDWKPLSRDAATLVAPAEPRARFEGWSVNDQTGRYFVGISEGALDGRKVVACTLASSDFVQSTLTTKLRGKLDLKPLNDEREAGQRYRAWTTSVNTQSVLVTLTTSQDESRPGGSLGAMVKVR